MKKLLLFLFITIISHYVYCQSTTITAGASGTLQLPTLSYNQIIAIPSPKEGMMVFDSTFKCLKYYNGTKWLCSTQTNDNKNAVGFAWKHDYNGYYGGDIVSKIYNDNNNNIYISGMLGGGYLYPFVAKYSTTGTLIWKYEPLSINYSNSPSLFTDADNNTYALFTIGWRGRSGTAVHKIQPNGNVDWIVGFPDYQSLAFGENMFIDNSQNIYVTGTFNGTITTEVGTISSTNGNAFVTKLNRNGTIQWIKNVPKTIVGISPNGESYFAGTFESSVVIEGNSYQSYGGSDIILGKLNTAGQVSWIKHIGGGGNDVISNASVDPNGNLYATGSFSNFVSFDGNTATSVDAEDFFIIKYNKDGIFNWVRNGGGIGKDEGINLQITYDNNIVISGNASSNTVTFYPEVIINPSTSPSKFLIKYNGITGDIVWVKPNEASNNFKVNKKGEVYSWVNVGNVDIYNPKGINIFTKYLENGEFVYRQINGGLVKDLIFGKSNNFFFTGTFSETVQIGATTLTCSDRNGDIFISHWIE